MTRAEARRAVNTMLTKLDEHFKFRLSGDVGSHARFIDDVIKTLMGIVCVPCPARGDGGEHVKQHDSWGEGGICVFCRKPMDDKGGVLP